MGLTVQSTQKGALKESNDKDIIFTKNIIALAGNPNVGKSTVFNSLTGLKQHTGNWPGKTVANAAGSYTYENELYTVIDLPGTYSLLSSSKEEEIARNFLFSRYAKTVVVVADATCLERNLNLVLQILEITSNCILCVNLMDEAKKKKIKIDLNKLQSILQIPVVGICASKKRGTLPLLEEIKKLCDCPVETRYTVKYDSVIESSITAISDVLDEEIKNISLSSRFIAVKLLCADKSLISSIEENIKCDLTNNQKISDIVDEEKQKLASFGITDANINDKIAFSLISDAEKISSGCVTYQSSDYIRADKKADRIITSKIFGIPIMLTMLGIIFYLSVVGANYPSQLLSAMFSKIELWLTYLFKQLNSPQWLYNILVTGMFRTLAWVTSVMLPPMAIFFPLFTLLEDLGYLPRVAFNLDSIFKKCHAHGKQCLTMCMGLGCNAAGVTGTRIIDSPRERLIAIITNNFMPCNGRFPILITISTVFLATGFKAGFNSVISAAAVLAMVVLGVIATFALSYILSSTLLKGTPSQFTLELPPYRKPKIWEVIYRSIFDRTLFVLARAAAVAAPAGAVIWLTANIYIGETSILNLVANFFDPFAKLLGLDGYILVSFILGIPANEIVMPILMMCYSASGVLTPLGTLAETGALLIANGWNILTAVNMMLFTLFHFPCATTILTIYKETKSIKWTFASFVIPTALGIAVCFLTTFISGIFI